MSEVRTQRLSVRRTARYHLLGTPGPAVRELWYVLHGYGQLARDFLGDFAAVRAQERLLVAPEGLSRFYLRGTGGRIGATWMTSEDRLAEIEDYVGYLDALHDHVRAEVPGAAAVHALGFSQGTATAFRWAALGRAPVARLTLWAGEVPPDLDLAAHRGRLERMRITLVGGSEDPYLSEERRARDRGRLEESGLAWQTLAFEGGHRLDDEALRRLAAG